MSVEGTEVLHTSSPVVAPGKRFDPYTTAVSDPNACLVYTTEVDDEDPTANCPKCTRSSWKRFCVGRGTRCCLYCRHSRREAGKRKCQYFLALLSVLFIVFVAALCFTIADRASSIFLQQAEDSNGEIDLLMKLAEGTNALGLNYTRLFLSNKQSDLGKFNTFRTILPGTLYSPQCTAHARSQGWNVDIGSTDHEWMYTSEPIEPEVTIFDVSSACRGGNCVSSVCAPYAKSTASVYIVDEDKEREIGLGRNFRWSAPSQPNKSFFMAKVDAKTATRMGAQKGDVVPMTIHLNNLISVIGNRGVQMLLAQQQKAIKAGDIHNTDYVYRDAYDTMYDEKYTKVYGSKHDLYGFPLVEVIQEQHGLLQDDLLRSRASIIHVMVLVDEVVDNWEGRFAKGVVNPVVLRYLGRKDSNAAYTREDASNVLRNPAISLWAKMVTQDPLMQTRNTTRMMEVTGISRNITSFPLLPFPPAAILLAGAAQTPLHELATHMIVNLPPERTETYLDGDYESMLKEIVDSLSLVVAQSGFVGVEVELPVLDEMNSLKMFSLFLGLIMSILLFILCIQSLMLVYSLMMVSVETRTFETAVHRMLGIGRLGIVNMLLTQAFSYALPAWVQGLILAQQVAFVIIKMLSDSVGVPLDNSLDGVGILVASLLGLGVPLLASILPIIHALKVNIQDALDVQRQGKPTVTVTVERTADNPQPLGPLFLGIGMTVCGFCVFYQLPQSLVTMNQALFFNIFFAILIGMLLGLILLAMNVQHLLESQLVFILLVFETRANKALVKKNQSAHRNRNTKTSLMYALSMAFVIFIQVALKTEQNASLATEERNKGSDIVLSANDFYLSSQQAGYIEDILQRYSVSRYSAPWSAIIQNIEKNPDASGWYFDKHLQNDGCIEDWGYITSPLESYDTSTLLRVSNDGNAFEHTLSLKGVSSSFSAVTSTKYNVEEVLNYNSGMTASESLYTVRGGQGVIIDSGMQHWTGIKGQGRDSVLKQKRLYDDDIVVDRLGVMGVYNSQSGTYFTKRSRSGAYMVLTSIPLFLELSGDDKYIRQGTGRTGTTGITEDDLHWDKVMIKTTSNLACTTLQRAELKQLAAGQDIKYWDLKSNQEDSSSTMDMLEIVFTIIMWQTLTLCLFSLTATTYCNVVGSSPEIAVLRALGMTKAAIIRFTQEECFILVISSALIGILIGFLMAWTMLLQRVLFTDLPISFEFPYSSVYWVLLAAFASSLAACTSPQLLIMKQTIAKTFKTYL